MVVPHVQPSKTRTKFESLRLFAHDWETFRNQTATSKLPLVTGVAALAG
jgi:hypothetical protein